MRTAYADPPYVGMAKRHYGDQPVCKEVNHRLLIGWLCDEFPDGWALSCSSMSMRGLLNMCPDDTLVGAWVKPGVAGLKGTRIIRSWEPVLYRTARRGRRTGPMCFDWVKASTLSFAQTRDPNHVRGAKPDEFCFWVFRLLGIGPGDEFVDVFPGSGRVARAWETWIRQRSIEFRTALPKTVEMFTEDK